MAIVTYSTHPSHAPFILQTVGDNFNQECRIMSIIWTGATTDGDTAELRDFKTMEVIWGASTSSSQTYKGIVYPKPHVGCGGFFVSVLAAGKLIVQIAQET